MSRLSGIKKFSIADAFTISGAISGCLAVFFLITLNPDITIGTSFIILALIMDGCDGAAARRFGSKHEYGRHLDSIADALSFCLAPGVLIYVTFYNNILLSVQGLLSVLVMILVVTFGWTRLYGFSTKSYKLDSFSGLPTPANAFMVVIISHILADQWVIALPILLVGAFLQVMPVPYPKVRGKVAVILAIAIALSFVVMLTPRFTATSEETFATYQVLSFLGFAIIIAYVLGGPIYERRGKKSHGA